MRHANDNRCVERQWRWRNCRSLMIGFMIAPFPWDWQIGWQVIAPDGEMEYAAQAWSLQLGPLVISARADIGNCRADGWRGRMGLSELEAWERSGTSGR